MHFSANVEESPLQTDAETGGEPELGTSREGHLGVPSSAVPLQGGGVAIPAL